MDLSTSIIEPAISAKTAKQAGMALAEDAEDVRVRELIREAIVTCATEHQIFTSDDVKPYVSLQPKKWQMIGPAMTRAAKRKICVKNGYRDTHHRESHCRPKQEWRSLIYQGGTA